MAPQAQPKALGVLITMFVQSISARASFRRNPENPRSTFPLIAFQLLLALPLGASFAAGAASLADKPDNTYVTDGSVNAVVRSGDTIFIGGQFTRVGPRTGPGVEVALNGTQTPGLPEISGAGPTLGGGATTGLRAVVADGSGGWYVSGLFTHVGAAARTNLAHILADHSVDAAFNPSMNGSVNALAVSGSTLYLGGLFTLVDGQVRNNIAALNTADGSLKAFNPNADAAVNALAVSSDGLIVYAGGNGFATIGGQSRTALAALNAADGSATTTFNPVLSGGLPSVSALAISGSTLYVAGNFNMVGALSRRALAALSIGGANDGNVVAAFDPAPTYFSCVPCASIEAMAVSGSTVYVGGSFDTIGGQSRDNLAGLNAADGSATAFDPGPHQNILSLAASGSIVYVGGGFNSIGGQPRNYMAALNAADGSATAFNPNPNGTVSTIGVSGSAVYLGGQFSSLGGVLRNSLAAINAADGTATAWDAHGDGMNGNYVIVDALTVSGSTMYVGGSFVTIGGQARNNIASLNLADGIATAWDPDCSGSVNAIALSGNLVYAGGSFLNIGGQQRFFLAALDATNGTATSWDPSPDSSVYAIVVSAGTVYVSGGFLHVSGEVRSGLAAFNTADGSLSSWDPNLTPIPTEFSAFVNALAISGSTLYAGGGFGSVQGVTRNNIAGINTSDGAATSFDPEPSGDGTEGGVITALAVDGSTVYAGGYFTTIGGQPRSLLAALDASDGSANSFNPNGSGGLAVYALAVATDGTLYAGGSFPTFDLAPQQSFASFTPAVPNDLIFSDGFESP
jgi:hypothetical protein